MLEEVRALVHNLLDKYTTETEFVKEQAVVHGMKKLEIHPEWLTAAARYGLECLIDKALHRSNVVETNIREHWEDDEYIDEHIGALPKIRINKIRSSRKGEFIIYEKKQCRSEIQDAYYKKLQGAGKLATLHAVVGGVYKLMVETKAFDLRKWGYQEIKAGKTKTHKGEIAVELSKGLRDDQTPLEGKTKEDFDKITKKYL